MTLWLLAAAVGGLLAGAILAGAETVFRPSRQQILLLGIGLGAGLGAMMATGSPTASGPLNVLLRGGAGVALVLLGARARPQVITAVAIGTVLVSYGTSVLGLAVLSLGIALSASLSDEDCSLARGAAAAILLQASLRLTVPRFQGGTALVAVVLLGPIVVSGMARVPATARTRVRRIAVAIGLGMGVFTVLAAVSALVARSSLERGISVLDSASVISSSRNDPNATARLATADRSFTTAATLLNGLWNRPAAAVPLVGQQWRVLQAVAVSGKELARAGRRALQAPGVDNLASRDGQYSIESIVALKPTIDDAAKRLQAASHRLHDARSSWLLPFLSKRLDHDLARVDAAATTASSASRALPNVPGLLGANGPRRYFLAIQTPAELRGSGGIIGNYGEIEADNGRVSLTRFGRIGDLNNAGGNRYERTLVAPQDFVNRYQAFGPHHEWLNINLSPDFPTDAKVIAGLYTQSGGQPIDGVIAIDPYGLAALLKLVGPIQSPNWPTLITSDNVVQILLYDQYQQFAFEDRVDFLGELAQEVWRRVTSQSLPGIREVLTALAPAVHGKHFMMSSFDPREEEMLRDVYLSGDMAPVNGDFIGVVTQNAGGNKLDAYLKRQVDYRVDIDPGSHKLNATVTVTLTNTAPSGLPGYVADNVAEVGIRPGDNKAWVSIYSPWALRAASANGSPVDVESARELGRHVYALMLVVPFGGSATFELQLTGVVGTSGGYGLDVFRQPAVGADEVRADVSIRGPWQVKGGGRRWTTRMDLSADERLVVPLERRY